MGLSTTDLDNIRAISKDASKEAYLAIENDIREIYGMLASMKHDVILDEDFRKLTIKQKILTLHTELVVLAQDKHIQLPQIRPIAD